MTCSEVVVVDALRARAFRAFARPLHGSVGCYLDDLFVAPDARGTGAVDALLQQLGHRAAENNWDVVRWITRPSNARARVVYDRTGNQTDLVINTSGRTIG